MIRYFSILIIVGIVLIVSSCVKEVDNIDLPDEEPKIVVGSFNSPNDSVHSLALAWSKPIYGDNTNPWGTDFIDDAQVILSDGIQSHQMTYNSSFQAFLLDTNQFKFTVGQKISVDIIKDNHHVIANSVIPEPPAYKVEHLNTVNMYEDDYFVEYKHILKFTMQNTNATNYYRIYSQLQKQGEFYWGNDNFFKGENGKEVRLEVYSWRDKTTPFVDDTLLLSIMNCEESYYHYHQSINNFTGDNPFAEPTIVFSNINNGLGVFCSFQKSEELIIVNNK